MEFQLAIGTWNDHFDLKTEFLFISRITSLFFVRGSTHFIV
jgi:hypothetical protein